MKISKTVFVVLLTVFCLAIMVVTAIPIGSINPGDYNPILDINHDGIINMRDLGSEAKAFMTSGDPTVPANVTNWPQTYSVQTSTVNMTSIGTTFPQIFCGGYSRLSVLIGSNVNANIGAGNNITIFLSAIEWDNLPSPLPSALSFDYYIDSSKCNFTTFNGINNWIWPSSYITETKGPYGYLYFGIYHQKPLPANWWVTFDYAVYLRNE